MLKIISMIDPFITTIFFCDSPRSYAVTLQDPASPSAEGMLFFHNYLMFFLIVIGVVVVWCLTKAIINSHNNIILKRFTHSSYLEIGWTLIPAILLLFLAVPSFCLLYSLDELTKSTIVLKVLGHQWFWSYEYTETGIDEEGLSYDSYIVDVLNTENLRGAAFRLLETDERVVLPIKTHVKLLISSSDVLHSWALPSLGIKVDACPGRLTEASLFIKREGVFYGQCSEICGVNHGFMPIVLVGTTFENYMDFLFAWDKEISYLKNQKFYRRVQDIKRVFGVSDSIKFKNNGENSSNGWIVSTTRKQ